MRGASEQDLQIMPGDTYRILFCGLSEQGDAIAGWCEDGAAAANTL